MRKIVYLLLLLITIILFSIVYFNKKLSSAKSKVILINNHKIKVEIADTDSSREKGLSDRVDLPQDEGMLFIFSSSGYHYFWMKGMLYPLDFIWIDDDTIVDLTENVPIIKNGQNNVVPSFTSHKPADKILEVNSGIIKLLNISIGDKIRYE